MTGRRNRAPKPHGSSPRAPLFHWLFIWIKKWDRERFQLERTATKFSANIIWLLVYLFAENFLDKDIEKTKILSLADYGHFHIDLKFAAKHVIGTVGVVALYPDDYRYL